MKLNKSGRKVQNYSTGKKVINELTENKQTHKYRLQNGGHREGSDVGRRQIG